uniref:Uncharacterized protein n=1 Tax=Sphaerodactylus townsendi TaxID=933632 RepID=A0ACB8F0T0_9SAUR
MTPTRSARGICPLMCPRELRHWSCIFGLQARKLLPRACSLKAHLAPKAQQVFQGLREQRGQRAHWGILEKE